MPQLHRILCIAYCIVFHLSIPPLLIRAWTSDSWQKPLRYSYYTFLCFLLGNFFLLNYLLMFFCFQLVKAALKLQNGLASISFWFVSSYLFNISTYAVTLFYVWSFYFFNFDNYHEEVNYFHQLLATINCASTNISLITQLNLGAE